MTESLYLFIRYSIVFESIVLCAYYIFINIFKTKRSTTFYIALLCSSIVIASLCSLLRVLGFEYYRLSLLLFSFLPLLLISKPHLRIMSLPVYLVSIGISYGIELLSIIILGSIFYFVGFREIPIFNEVCLLFIQLIIVFLLMKIKRLKNLFTIFKDKNNFGIGLLISGIIVTFTNIHRELLSYERLSFIIIGIILTTIGLIIWILRAITRHYRKRLKLRAEEYSKLELAEKSKEIEKLSDENTSLSSIIHLDNQIIQTIETELNKLSDTEPANKLLISINQRNDYVNSVLIKSKNLASTGNAGVDAILLDLYIKAASRGIDFNLNTDCDINYLINNIITKDDFETLLCELITNSIIAVENNPKITGRISINISQPNDIYELTVMDNGSFIDNNSIPDTIEKSKASITTNHFENNDSFTKSVTIRFDGLNMNERIF